MRWRVGWFGCVLLFPSESHFESISVGTSLLSQGLCVQVVAVCARSSVSLVLPWALARPWRASLCCTRHHAWYLPSPSSLLVLPTPLPPDSPVAARRRVAAQGLRASVPQAAARPPSLQVSRDTTRRQGGHTCDNGPCWCILVAHLCIPHPLLAPPLSVACAVRACGVCVLGRCMRVRAAVMVNHALVKKRMQELVKYFSIQYVKAYKTALIVYLRDKVRIAGGGAPESGRAGG